MGSSIVDSLKTMFLHFYIALGVEHTLSVVLIRNVRELINPIKCQYYIDEEDGI
jgi:hypothetical protein